MRIEESVEINRPLEEVFNYVANPENLPEWSSIVLEVRKEAQGQPREGDRFTTVAKFLGRSFETPMEVTAHEPPTPLRQEHGRPIPAGVHVHLGGNGGRPDALDAAGGGRAGRLLQVGRTAARDGGQAAVQG